MSAAQLIPDWRLIHASRFLCRKLSSHQSPRPIRSTAAHSAPLSQVVRTPMLYQSPLDRSQPWREARSDPLTPGVSATSHPTGPAIAGAESGSVDDVEARGHDGLSRRVIPPDGLGDDEGHRAALGLLRVGVDDCPFPVQDVSYDHGPVVVE